MEICLHLFYRVQEQSVFCGCSRLSGQGTMGTAACGRMHAWNAFRVARDVRQSYGRKPQVEIKLGHLLPSSGHTLLFPSLHVVWNDRASDRRLSPCVLRFLTVFQDFLESTAAEKTLRLSFFGHFLLSSFRFFILILCCPFSDRQIQEVAVERLCDTASFFFFFYHLFLDFCCLMGAQFIPRNEVEPFSDFGTNGKLTLLRYDSFLIIRSAAGS